MSEMLSVLSRTLCTGEYHISFALLILVADGTCRLWALISLSFGVPLASVNNFLPQIVASLGYSTIKTNLFTVAPNIVGTVALLLLTFSSDYFRERSIHM